ncbi:Advillin [Arthrobotrys entomopaga]|nr:Advillin [Arthrobotrys entomopaga]
MDPPSEADDNQVTEFLQRIRELDDKRDREDEERTRKLEEDILARREARQKLRAERARSLSPEKLTPVGTPLSYKSKAADSSPMVRPEESPLASKSRASTVEPAKDENRNEALERLTSESRPLPTPPAKPANISTPTLKTASHTFSPSPASVTGSTRRPFNRAGQPLSWQRRPQSVAFGEKTSFTAPSFSRASSVAADDNESDAGSEISREQISKNLGSKDPSYFRQTPERGFKSAALRKDAEDNFTGGARMALPGMSERTPEPQRPVSSMSNASASSAFSTPTAPSRTLPKANSFLDSLPDERPLSASETPSWKTPTSVTKAHQQIEASFSGLSVKGEEGGSPMPSSYNISNSGRLSPERMMRPASPTKGLGGFVQSAMLKREASMRKGGPPGNPMASLSRSGSNVSDKEWTASIRRERGLSTLSRGSTPGPDDRENDERRVRENSPTESVVSTMTTSTDGWRGRTEATPPASPSKTMNPRRWSPTKSSWLESALQKDIAPIIGSQPPPMFAPSRENSNRSPTREKSIRNAKDAAAIREERARARMAASAVPRKMSVDSQASDQPRFDASFMRPAIQPKSTYLSKRPLSEIFTPPPAADFTAPSEQSVAEEKLEDPTKSEMPSSIPRPVVPAKPSLPDKPINGSETKDKPPVKSKPVFERGAGSSMPVDPRAAREASLREKQQAKKEGVLDFRSRLNPSKTQNYKAPDELKDTILAGKSALQDRGGPHNFRPPNELKDKVLAAKAALQDRGGPQNYKPPNELKETVLAARGNLQPSLGPQRYQAPDPLKQTVSTARSQLRPSSPTKNSPNVSPTKPTFGRSATVPFSYDEKDVEPVRSPETGDGVFEGKENSMPTVSKQMSAPAQIGGFGGKRDNFLSRNPEDQREDKFGLALARALQNGPPGMGRPGASSNNDSFSAPKSVASYEPAEGPQLTHMTKSRARGPKRRAPAASATPAGVEPEKPKTTSSPQPRSINPTRRSLGQSGLGASSSPNPVTPSKPSTLSVQSYDEDERQATPERKDKPPTPAKSPLLRTRSSQLNMRENLSAPTSNPSTPAVKPKSPLGPQALEEDLPAVKPLFFATPQERATPRRLPTPPSASVTPSPNAARPLPQPPMNSKSSFGPEESETVVAPSVKDSIARWGSTNSTPETTPQRKGMIKLPSYQDEVAAMESSRVYRSPQASTSLAPSPSPLRMGTSRSVDDSLLSVVGADAAKYLSQFFTGPVTSPPKGGIDVTPLLESKPKPHSEPVQTLKKQVWEITGINGKKDPVPVGQEHILYEDGLYMCLHSYMESSGMMSSEVFLWSGDRVSLGTVEEAQLSARRLAREYDGRLIVTQQGKETARFIEALGGIIITRRGSRARIQQDIPFMLCCRKVLGGIALDEVDIHFNHLCSGFPYIISTPDRLYLWKGKGSSTEELRAARAASFDLANDNEVKQIDEDKEPELFIEMMGGEPGGQTQPQYWSLKPQHMQYSTRVFLIDHEAPSSALEIYPFAQADLDPTNIYIVDAFFELYIVVGEQAQSKRLDFQHALLFTQEYSIMAASNEDRPFVPQSNVVLGGAPKELKAVFRRWEDSKTPTAWHPSRSPSVKLTMGLRDAMSMMDF